MIDTVCLLIPKSKVTIIDLLSLGVPAWNLHSRTEQYDKFVKNPSKKDKNSGLYFPRLTGYKRKNLPQEENIRIEFSAPKLLYLNNIDELEEKDFVRVIEALQDRLKRMGIIASKSLLENATISSVHFSKNIFLEDGYTANYLISEMNKINLRKSFDFAKTRFLNDGQSLYAHTASHQFVIYDKIADLGKDEKRAIDKDQTWYQLSLFSELQKNKELQEIIRFEVRLNQKQKLNKVLEDLGYSKNPTFKEIFNLEISKKVVSSYWNRIIKEKNIGLFSISASVKDLLQTLFLAKKKLKPKQAIYLIGLITLARDENGMRQLRTIVSKRSHTRTWYRIAKDMEKAGEIIAKNRIRDWVTQIDNKLEEYKPYKHKKYESNQNKYI